MTENLEYLHKLAREAEEKAIDLRSVINRILDVPARVGQIPSVYRDLIESGYSPGGTGEYGHGTAFSACRRIAEQRQQMLELCSRLQSETEILASIADDLIGKTGRLV